MRTKKAFYAYPGHKVDLLEDIHEAVKVINNSSEEIEITTWQDLSISGKKIIDGILKSIDNCDLFMCDLTYLNFNVLYELGYAISKGKKIWITLNSTHHKAVSNYKMFNLLKTIGYAEYKNFQDLSEKFFSDIPHIHSKTIDIEGRFVDLNKNLIYLKCRENTGASNRITSIIEKSQVPCKMDDPYEGNETIEWYLNLLPNSLGVIIHFHTRENEEENPIDTARKAFVAGLARGLDLRVILLAHKPFEAPLDYYDLLKVHATANDCETYFNEWFTPLLTEFREMEEKYGDFRAEQRALGKLSNLIVGDYVAENENHDLVEYFLETAEYREALNSQQVLFVGRKGTGKTANLIKIKNELSSDKRNFIVPIQPQGYEIEGILNTFSKLKKESEQGHLIESIWKYLIYTEIARHYFEHIENRPLHYYLTKEEEEFCDFVTKNKRLIHADFSLRLENVISALSSMNRTETVEEQRLKVSETLHDSMIKNLRSYLGRVLENKEKVTILIDNLDKNWNDKAEIKELSSILFGLLNVIHQITEEFHKSSYKHKRVNLSLIVFIRSDIFSRIMNFVDERDKIPTKQLSWSEPSLLFRVIENRIQYSRNGVTSPEELWGQYFCKEVGGLPLKDYISQLILPRPRDIIYLIKSALQEAVNRGHVKVAEEDFKSAELSYSEYALQSLLPENGGRIDDLESIFYEFAGVKSVIHQEQLEECLQKSSSQEVEHLIEILCEMTFLGKEIQENKFEYYGDKRPAKITDRLADKYASRKAQSKRYQINPAFHAYLGIEK